MERDTRIRDWDRDWDQVPNLKPVTLDDLIGLSAKLAGIAFCCLIVVACVCASFEALKQTFWS